jgi:hypothetical protein
MHPLTAFEEHKTAAKEALEILKSFMPEGKLPPRVPGMDTVIRLAVRIAQGGTPRDAAIREYLYRWRLAIKDFDQCGGRNGAVSIFGAPHTMGM